MASNGNNMKVQYGIETTYGTAETPTKQIQASSEGFKLVLNKKSEGLLTGGNLGSKSYTMSKKVEGSLATLVRPDDVGLFLACALGAEATPVKVVGSTGAYKHTFTISNDALPSLTFVVDKVVAAFEYTGVKVNSLSFNVSQEDLLKLDLNMVGKEEAAGTTETGLSNSPLRAFQFSNASYVKVANTSMKASSVKFEYNNNLQTAQYIGNGLYFDEPSQGTRVIKADVEVLYDSTSDDIRTDYFIEDTTCALELYFIGGEIETGFNYSLKILVPVCQVKEASPTVGGADTLKYNLQLEAVQPDSGEPITIELVNGNATAYI